MGVLDSLLGGIGSIVGSGISAFATNAQNKANRSFTREMFGKENAEYDRRYAQQRADYLSDLASEREYNSASAQAQRLREAGINPNGSQSPVTGGTSSGAQLGGSLSPGSPIAPAQFNVGNQLQAGIIAASQLDIQREQNEISRQNADTALFRAYSEAKLRSSQSKESGARTAGLEIENMYKDAILKGQIDKISSEIDMNRQRSFNLLQDSVTKMNLRDAQRNELLAKIDNLNATADLAYKNIELAAARIRESGSRKGLMDEQAQSTFVQREYQEWYNKLQKDLESTIKSIQSSSASKAAKEAANYSANMWFQNAVEAIKAVVYPLGEYYTHKGGKSFNQGYNYTVPVGY